MDETERLFQLGRAAYLCNDLGSAERLLRQALEGAPTNHQVAFALGAVLAKGGRIAEGYPLMSRRRAAEPHKAAPRLPIAPWRGEPVAGKRVLIWGEDGFGDQIMLARYALRMVAAGAEVSWMCAAPLARLLASTGVHAMPNTESVTISGVDFYCPSSALLPASRYAISGEAYIHAASAPRPGIGVMTFAGANHRDGPERSLPPAEAGRLLGLPGAVDLNPASTAASDFFDTARIIAGLDLVVTVDTAVAHLAGAMGKPVWVLLPYVGEWRWGLGERSPWYHTARLIRQAANRDWKSVVDVVQRDLSPVL